MKWQIVSSNQKTLHIQSWDNKEYIVYNSLSGDTHLLKQSAGKLLLQLRQFPADTETLTNLVVPVDRNIPKDHHMNETENLLEELSKLNLIEKIQKGVTCSPPFYK